MGLFFVPTKHVKSLVSTKFILNFLHYIHTYKDDGPKMPLSLLNLLEAYNNSLKLSPSTYIAVRNLSFPMFSHHDHPIHRFFWSQMNDEQYFVDIFSLIIQEVAVLAINHFAILCIDAQIHDFLTYSRVVL